MRILATLHPGTGHLNPLVPLLHALRAAGCDVLVATAASFLPEVARAGLPAVAAGRDWLESDAATTFPGFLESTSVGQLEHFLELAAQAADDLTSLAEEHAADLVLRESTEFGGWVAAQRTGRPHVEAGIIAPLGAEVLSMIAGEAFATLLSRTGLPPDPELTTLSDRLHLDPLPASFTPSWLGPPTSRVGYRRSTAYDGARPEDLPDWWPSVAASADPVVYVTLGTVYNQALTVFERVAEALASAPVQVVMATGRGVDPTDLQLPANVRAARYLPQSLVLPRADVVVCHAGCGTLLDCMGAGVPVVCVPFGADQLLNGLRVAELGAGVNLADQPVEGSPFLTTDVAGLEPHRVREAVDLVIDDGSYRTAMAGLRAELEGALDVDGAAAAVLACAKG